MVVYIRKITSGGNRAPIKRGYSDAGKDVEEREPLCTVGGNVIEFPQEIKNRATI